MEDDELPVDDDELPVDDDEPPSPPPHAVRSTTREAVADKRSGERLFIMLVLFVYC